MADKNPDGFVGIAAQLIPQQVAVDLQNSVIGRRAAAPHQEHRVGTILLVIADATAQIADPGREAARSCFGCAKLMKPGTGLVVLAANA